jgi:hypothetical protein
LTLNGTPDPASRCIISWGRVAEFTEDLDAFRLIQELLVGMGDVLSGHLL